MTRPAPTPAQRKFVQGLFSGRNSWKNESIYSTLHVPNELYDRASKMALTAPVSTLSELIAFLLRDSLDRYSGSPVALAQALRRAKQ